NTAALIATLFDATYGTSRSSAWSITTTSAPAASIACASVQYGTNSSPPFGEQSASSPSTCTTAAGSNQFPSGKLQALSAHWPWSLQPTPSLTPRSQIGVTPPQASSFPSTHCTHAPSEQTGVFASASAHALSGSTVAVQLTHWP